MFGEIKHNLSGVPQKYKSRVEKAVAKFSVNNSTKTRQGYWRICFKPLEELVNIW